MTIYYCVYFVGVKTKSVEVVFSYCLVRQCQLLPQILCLKNEHLSCCGLILLLCTFVLSSLYELSENAVAALWYVINLCAFYCSFDVFDTWEWSVSVSFIIKMCTKSRSAAMHRRVFAVNPYWSKRILLVWCSSLDSAPPQEFELEICFRMISVSSFITGPQEFYCFHIVILVNDQLDALFLNVFISTPLRVSSSKCSSSGGSTCINTPSGITHSGSKRVARSTKYKNST